jgi:hypothetical protein
VSQCDREASIMRRHRPPRGCRAIGKKNQSAVHMLIVLKFTELTKYEDCCDRLTFLTSVNANYGTHCPFCSHPIHNSMHTFLVPLYQPIFQTVHRLENALMFPLSLIFLVTQALISARYLHEAILLETLTVHQLVKNFQHFMEHKGSLPCSQEPAK